MEERAAAARLPPEILRTIFEYLSEHRKGSYLLLAARTCRAWSQVALEVLWNGKNCPTPEICVLDAMNKNGYLAKYLPFIKHLELDIYGRRPLPGSMGRPKSRPACPNNCTVVEDHHPFLESGIFARAESVVSLVIWLFRREMPPHGLRNILPPNLRVFSLGRGYLDEEMLDFIKSRAPNLESFKADYLLSGPITHVPDEHLVEFLKDMPRIKQLQYVTERLSLPLLRHLIQTPTLEDITVDQLAETEGDFMYLSMALANGPTCTHLRTLNIAQPLETKVAFWLLSMFPNLENIDLNIILHFEDPTLLRPFASLKTLRSLVLTFHSSDQVAAAARSRPSTYLIPNLIAVCRSCINLRCIVISTFSRKFDKISLEAAEFQNVFAEIPQAIEWLQLPFRRDFGRAEAQTFARFPRLQYVNIAGQFDLQGMQDWPVAPRLPSVKWVGWRPKPSDTAEDIGKIIRPVLPNVNPSCFSLAYRASGGDVVN